MVKREWKSLFLRIAVIVSVPFMVVAEPTESIVRPHRGTSLDDVFFSGSSVTSNGLVIKVHLSCFSSDLKSAPNPISPMGTVKMSLGVGPTSNMATHNGPGDFSVLFPGWLTMSREFGGYHRRDEIFAMNPMPMHKGAAVTAAQNLLIIRPPASITSGVTFNAAGEADPERVKAALKYVTFVQDIQGKGSCWGIRGVVSSRKPKVFDLFAGLDFLRLWASRAFAGGGYGGPSDDEITPDTVNPGPDDDGFGQPTPCEGVLGWDPAVVYSGSQVDGIRDLYSQYTGRDGPLSSQWSHRWSSDYQTLEITASFPGEMGFCGGFFSPLMVFLSKDRPKFNSVIPFAIQGVGSTRWPEYNASYGFLAVDWNKNGVIDDGSELFGATDKSKNGFETLAAYDDNKDGVIDQKDSVYRSIRVWRDSTGRGQTLEDDLVPLARLGIESIPLRYSEDRMDLIGEYAEFRERAPLVFKRGRQKLKGEIIDVWLATR